jgi:hypothetical protein
MPETRKYADESADKQTLETAEKRAHPPLRSYKATNRPWLQMVAQCFYHTKRSKAESKDLRATVGSSQNTVSP